MHFVTVGLKHILTKWPKVKGEKLTTTEKFFGAIFCQFLKNFGAILKFGLSTEKV